MIKPFLLLLTCEAFMIAMPPYQTVIIPSLEELCFNAMPTIPPEQFHSFQNIPPGLKLRFILKYGPTYAPTIFSVATDYENEDDTRIKGAIINQETLILRNRFVELLINKENRRKKDDNCELSSPLYTYAYLHHKNLYIGAQNGDLVYYEIKQRKPALVDIQHIAEHAITEIAVHPTDKELIACKYFNGTIDILKRDNQKLWNRIKNIVNSRSIGHMTFCGSEKWFACAEVFKAYIYSIDQDQQDIEILKSYVCPQSISALIFDENKNLIIQTTKNALGIKQLCVWNFLSEGPIPSYTLWPHTSKIMLKQDGWHSISLNDNEISHIAHKIMFKAQLAGVKTYSSLELFKKYADILKCEEQPLFKLIAITNKAAELQKLSA